MPLPAPKLDDREFQGLVDDAKRFIQQRCPEWTDHNVSDPGVTLIETFAWMTDLLLYRLNRVPDRVYVKFLELLGVQRHAPTAAYVDVDFRLSAPQDDAILVPAGTVVSTPRTPNDPAVAYTTTGDLTIESASIEIVASRIGNQRKIRDITGALGMNEPVPCFSDEPENDDAMYFGLNRPLPSHVVVLEFECDLGGHSIDPDRPPLRWEAWDGEDWVRCDLLRDETGGLNLSGRIELALPEGHQIADIDDHRFAWIRCRVATTATRRPYRSSPLIKAVSAYVAGASTEAVNAEFIDSETLGVSTGVAGQTFMLMNAPVVPSDEPFAILVSRSDRQLESDESSDPEDGANQLDGTDYEVWELVADFAGTGPDDRHFTLDAHDGVVKFGPMVREPDGSPRHHGAIPPKGSTLVAPRYRTGGGGQGNVSPHAISVLRTSIPKVSRVDNRRAARGGVDSESVEDAKDRGPVELRVRNRAVTIEDFEYLAKEAAPNLARVKALQENDADGASAVRVLLVPTVGDPDDELELRDLYPPEQLRDRVAEYLDHRRLVGTRIVVTPPTYLGLRIKTTLVALDDANVIDVERAANSRLRQYFHPVQGGRDGRGWPFGRSVTVGEVYSVLQQVPGVDIVQQVELRAVNPEDDEDEAVGDVLELYATDLLLPVDHDITVGP